MSASYAAEGSLTCKGDWHEIEKSVLEETGLPNDDLRKRPGARGITACVHRMFIPVEQFQVEPTAYCALRYA